MTKHIFFYALIAFVLTACHKEEEITAVELPSCIMTQTEENNFLRVHVQELNGERHYRIGSGCLSCDEPIVNAQCEEVCFFGGWVNPACLEDYADDWMLVWPE